MGPTSPPIAPPPAPPPRSSARLLLWLGLAFAVLLVVLYAWVGDAWLRWFPRE